MLGSIFSAVGSGIGTNFGKFLGGGILSRVGRYVGSYGGRILGNYLERKWFYKKQTFEKISNLRDSFYFAKAEYGSPIPLIFGKMRVQGKIIWLSKVVQGQNSVITNRYFTMPKQVKSTTTNTTFFYHLSFAVAICEGEISEIGRVWYGDELIDISRYKYRLYNGSETQQPDPLIIASEDGEIPAFRGLAYIVFEKLPLADFDDTIPNFSFEVTRKVREAGTLVVEDMVKSMIMIPGSGEYVYDTIIQKKSFMSNQGRFMTEQNINVHNEKNIADAVHSLNQLQEVCLNVEWVAPVVSWFANSMNLAECVIRPAIEFRDPKVQFSEEWLVGAYNRNNAAEVSKGQYGIPNYGGTVNDASLIRYLKELKKRGLNIMLYPMFFMDVEGKPWRGRLTGSPEEISRFFNKKEGYKEFILHYANIAKDYVDAFIIGSELIGLTRVKNSANKFPAVEELTDLAASVKKIVGSKVAVTYAADWSEYHHTDGGWYNLDELWGSPNIDFIGIDAYFPVTNTESSIISDQEIQSGFSSGEGYEYFIEGNTGNKQSLSPEYAWKNLKFWWENSHKNPDGKYTNWVPKSKKIWFTEFGFPSVDKAPNQPNVFFDPNCIDGNIPKFSDGSVNFSLQRRCIQEFIKYWEKEEYIGRMFLWTWDARPYPAWPHMKIWRDSYLWEKGHWVNNKFGSTSIGAIIFELSKKCGIDCDKLDVSSVDEAIEGFIVNSSQTCMDVINSLRISHLFDIHVDKDIHFIKRGNGQVVEIPQGDLVKNTDNSYLSSREIAVSEIISQLNIHYINNLREYENYFLQVGQERAGAFIEENLHLSIALSPGEVERIGNLILQNAEAERKEVELVLPIEYLDLKPGMFIKLYYENNILLLRIIECEVIGLKIRINSVLDDIAIYSSYTTNAEIEARVFDESRDKLIVLELPFYLPGEVGNNLIAYYSGKNRGFVETKRHGDPDTQWMQVSKIDSKNIMGTVAGIHTNNKINCELIDNISEVIVSGIDGALVVNGQWYVAKFGSEYIRFKNIEKLEDGGHYKISYLVRGEFGSAQEITNHKVGEDFVILTEGYKFLPLARFEGEQNFDFRLRNGNVVTASYNHIKAQPQIPYFTHKLLDKDCLEIRIYPKIYVLDSWAEIDEILAPEYSVNISAKEGDFSYKTKNMHFLIKNSSIGLSGGYKVDIVTVTSQTSAS